MTKNEDLKACPFCGGTDLEDRRCGTDDECSFVRCKGCEAGGPTCTPRQDEDEPDWNTRPTVTPTDNTTSEQKYGTIKISEDSWEWTPKRNSQIANAVPTDGDAEKCKAIVDKYYPQYPSGDDKELYEEMAWHYFNALQSTRKPDAGEMYEKGYIQGDFDRQQITARKLPVDTKPREVEHICDGGNCGLDPCSESRDCIVQPVDTINIKKEVLQGVRDVLKRTYYFTGDKFSEHFYPDLADKVKQALASLDAVLAEGE